MEGPSFSAFVAWAPEYPQRMILWCLRVHRTPSRRPAAEALRSVGCLEFPLS
jgi:hypothetical protein